MPWRGVIFVVSVFTATTAEVLATADVDSVVVVPADPTGFISGRRS